MTSQTTKGCIEFEAERLAEKICLEHGFYHHKDSIEQLILNGFNDMYKRGGVDSAAFIDGVQVARGIKDDDGLSLPELPKGWTYSQIAIRQGGFSVGPYISVHSNNGEGEYECFPVGTQHFQTPRDAVMAVIKNVKL